MSRNFARHRATTLFILSTWARLAETIAYLSGVGVPRALDNATPFLWAFGHIVVAWIWLDQASAASVADPSDNFAKGKVAACQYFFECELPKADAWLDLVASGSGVAASVDPDIF